ncbi:MAG TPA: hypothetical protein VFO25_08285 [Candidatus Eremiobacteraceae bacterium]|nr:hypothetical protein [Candidatus Eremiobacteraceae bacterium]
MSAMMVATVIAFALSHAPVEAMATAESTPIRVTLIEGFGRAIYATSANAAPSASSPRNGCFFSNLKPDLSDKNLITANAPFDSDTKAYWLAPRPPQPSGCDYVGVKPTTDGLAVIFSVARRDVSVVPAGANRVGGFAVSTLFDNVPQNQDEDRIVIDISPAAGGPAVLSLTINPDEHVFGRSSAGDGGPKTLTSNDYSMAPDLTQVWAGILTINWSAFKSTGGWSALRLNASRSFEVRYRLLRFGNNAPSESDPAGALDVAFTTVPAFDTELQPLNGLGPSDSHRYGAIDKTGQRQTGSQGNPSATPLPTTTPWPALSFDTNFPATQQTLVGATLAQDFASNLGTVQQKIVKLAGKVGVPSQTAKALVCASCQPFQVLYGTLFGLKNSSDVVSLLSGNNRFGEDAQPITFGDIGDLGVASVFSYANNDTSLSLAQMHARNTLDDDAAMFTTKTPSSEIRALAVGDNHPPTSALPHISTDALSLSSDHPTGANDDDDPAKFESSDVSSIVRAAYDATDTAVDGFAGVQFAKTISDSGEDEFGNWHGYTMAIAPGYKFGGIAYRQAETDPLPFVGASGPSVDANLAGTALWGLTPSVNVESYWLRNRLLDLAQSTDVVYGLQWKPTVKRWTFKLSFEQADARISAPFIALQQIANLPTPDTYPGIRSHIEPTPAPNTTAGPSSTDDLEDHIIAVSATTPKYFALQATATVGYDIDHLSPVCLIDPKTVADIICTRGHSANLITGTVLGGWKDWLQLGARYQPPQTSQGSPLTSDERVYNAFLEGKVGRCNCKLMLAASNDSGRIGVNPNTLGEALTAQFAIEGIFQKATLAFGYINSSSPSSNFGSTPVMVTQPLDHRAREFVVLRVGTAAFETTKGY